MTSFYVPGASHNKDKKNYIQNTINSLTNLLTGPLFTTTYENKHLILHLGALGFSTYEEPEWASNRTSYKIIPMTPPEPDRVLSELERMARRLEAAKANRSERYIYYKSSVKLNEIIKKFEKPYELVILAIDGLFNDVDFHPFINYVNFLGFLKNKNFVNPRITSDTYSKLYIIPGYLQQDDPNSECLALRAFMDLQTTEKSLEVYASYPKIMKNKTSNLLSLLCRQAIEEGGNVFIQSYLNWDTTASREEFMDLRRFNIGSNFENIISLVQQLHNLDHDKLFLIPNNNFCKRYEIHKLFSPEAVTKFADNKCVETRLGRKIGDFVLTPKMKLILDECLSTYKEPEETNTASPAAGAGSSGGTRRRKGKKRYTLRQKR